MQYAVVSGFCAATASVFGKLSGAPTLEGLWLARVLCFSLMLVFNAGVWTFFVRALHRCDTAVSATVASSASNYVFSALYGFFFFGEATTLLWWTGMSLVLCGLVLIVKNNQSYPVGTPQDDKHSGIKSE